VPKPFTSLWPSEFGELGVQTPLAILRQQAGDLGQMTQNIVYGSVLTLPNPEAGGFRHQFNLFCPPLAYTEYLLWVDHGLDLYPATIIPLGRGASPRVDTVDPDNFKQELQKIFENERTKKIIRVLLAQSKQQ